MIASIYQLKVDITHQLTIAQPLCHSQLMVDKTELRASFSARLHEALNDAGVRARGRGVDIHNRLKSVGVRKTTQAVSKWLNGEAIAEADSMAALCSWLRVRREWLEYGVEPKSSETHLTTSTARNSDDSGELGSQREKIPLISWSEAEAWCDQRRLKASSGRNWISSPIPLGRLAFALEVMGDSMTNPGPGRNYPAGCIIFVDPEAKVSPGDRVIARVPHSKNLTFKVFVEDAGRHYLRPINPQYPILDITETLHICGKVLGTFIPD